MDTQSAWERRAAIAQAVRNGMTVHQAASHYGVGMTTAYNALKEHSVVVDGRSCTKGTYEILADLLNTFDTLEEIGKRHGKSMQRVLQILNRAREAGIKIEHRPPRINHASRRDTA